MILGLFFGSGRAPTLLLLGNCDSYTTAGTGSSRRARTSAKRPTRFPDGNHDSVVEMVAFCRTVATDTWRAIVPKG